MPLEQLTPAMLASPAPGGAWRVWLMGLAGLVGFLGIGLLVSPARPAAALAGLGVAILCVLLSRRRSRTQAAGIAVAKLERQDADTLSPDARWNLPDAATRGALERLPDPVLIVEGGEPDDPAGRRIVFANTVARATLRIQRDGALLVTILRDPEVLEIIDESLFGGLERSTAFETHGAQDRFWRVWSRPLPAGHAARRLALVCLRDETEARRLEQMRADFLANASHELRTPLASLSGFIETLKGHARDDAGARARFLDIMAAQADRMGRLIADLLSLSRIELNEHVPPSGEADLTQVAADVVDALSLIAQAKGVRLQLQAPPLGQARVPGDRDQILQVVQNLVDNGLKYTPRDGVVRIEVQADLAAEAVGGGAAPSYGARLALLTPDHASGVRYARVRVADGGPGIAREHMPRLTERFYRVEGQKSGEKLGTGLGLAIVKHIVNRHRGALTVESPAGSGAVFTAYFPAASTTAAPQAAVRYKTVAELS